MGIKSDRRARTTAVPCLEVTAKRPPWFSSTRSAHGKNLIPSYIGISFTSSQWIILLPTESHSPSDQKQPHHRGSVTDVTGVTTMASDNEQSFAALLSKLTLQEKISLLSGNTFNTTPGVPRLGIPQIKVCLP